MKCYIDKHGYNIVFKFPNKALINFVDVENGNFISDAAFEEDWDEYVCDISDDLYIFIEKLYATNN